MTNKKGKAPAFWFYPKDWLGDSQLQMASPTTRGIWANFLSYMWLAPDKGELEGTFEELQKLAGASKDELDVFFKEAKRHKFCDIGQFCPGIVTVINRRMSQEDAERRKARLRKRKQRERQQENEDVTGDVTGDVTEMSTPHIAVCNIQHPCHREDCDICCSEQKDSEPPVLSIPLVNRDGIFEVFQKDIDEWSDVFPGIDVKACLKYIRTWNKDNPKKRKTKSGIRRHITTWLEKEQNKGPRSTYCKITSQPEDQSQLPVNRHRIPDGHTCMDCVTGYANCRTGPGSRVCVHDELDFQLKQ